MANFNYAKAPYNFISFPSKVVYKYESENELPVHNKFYKENNGENLNTGFIEYIIKNETLLFIGGEKNNEGKNIFFNINGEKVIPAGTMRGKIRSNAEILSFAYPQFVEDRRLMYRGFTDKSIVKDILEKQIEIENQKIDYVEAIFGFIDDKKINMKNSKSYKGRVSFTDLKNIGKLSESIEKKIILSNPKPNSFQLYLDKKKIQKLKIDNQDLELRGSKFYWLRDEKGENNLQGNWNQNIGSSISYLKEGNEFSGKIYFENLTDDELGLILLALKYNDETRDSIGMGKPYGYGRINIKKINLYIEDKKASLNNFFDFESNDYNKTSEIERYKEKFKEVISKEIEKKYEDDEIIKNYVYSKKVVTGKNKLYNIKYMEWKEFKNRELLPTIEEFKKI